MSEESTGNKLIQIVQKIQIFKGLTTGRIRKILASCSHKIYQVGELVCRSNIPSDEMSILIAGELAVVTVEGLRVVTISPVTTVGEMGVFTGQPRSATVEAQSARAMSSVSARCSWNSCCGTARRCGS